MADLTITAVWSIIIEIQFGSAVKGDTMNVTRIISIMLGLIAAVLIAMAGKSCAKDIAEKNKERRMHNTSAVPSYHLITDPPATADSASIPILTTETESTTEREYITVTNLLGEVLETIPVTTPEEALIPTTTLSILEEYEARHNQGTTSIYEAPSEEIPYVSIDPEGFSYEMTW